MSFHKTIYKVNIIDPKQIKIDKVSSKVATLVRKQFLSGNFEVAKVYYQKRKIEKVQICQIAPRPLRRWHMLGKLKLIKLTKIIN